MFAFGTGLMFAGTLANLGSLNRSNANGAKALNFERKGDDHAALNWSDDDYNSFSWIWR